MVKRTKVHFGLMILFSVIVLTACTNNNSDSSGDTGNGNAFIQQLEELSQSDLVALNSWIDDNNEGLSDAFDDVEHILVDVDGNEVDSELEYFQNWSFEIDEDRLVFTYTWDDVSPFQWLESESTFTSNIGIIEIGSISIDDSSSSEDEIYIIRIRFSAENTSEEDKVIRDIFNDFILAEQEGMALDTSINRDVYRRVEPGEIIEGSYLINLENPTDPVTVEFHTNVYHGELVGSFSFDLFFEIADDESGDDDEIELEPDEETRVEMVVHLYTTQVFNVTTDLEEIVLRIEHSGENWIGSPFDDVFDDVVEEVLEVGESGAIELFVGAVHNMDAIYINDVEVEFVSPEVGGTQHFIFNIEFIDE